MPLNLALLPQAARLSRAPSRTRSPCCRGSLAPHSALQGRGTWLWRGGLVFGEEVWSDGHPGPWLTLGGAEPGTRSGGFGKGVGPGRS